MPHFVVRLAPDTDAYVLWSTTSDRPVTTVLTREQTAQTLHHRGEVGDGMRLDRADIHGTSATGDADGTYSWDDPHILVADIGGDWRLVPRTQLLEFCRALDSGDTEQAVALSQPAE